MSLELRAVMRCDRCDAEVVMDNIDDRAEAERRVGESEWCESEDGELVCPSCWEKWEAARQAKETA